ncbi:RluA family pseudouridine synthase [Dehalococcoides mccartyi]|uniref:Pseudouridine synthase n=3 Tax=Dehalococcoides mccartyi TaxID=61435 RepID=A0A142VB23_9CHLR|nr:RluA family pseudouridine synthase [Dehalococcoides mccartyi]AII61331.1 RNA pseudouridine synthase [Dehalococcoides mccartyi CG5]AMU87030.1 ribosomal large subunit pseudouridine synthase, RluD subfamily [Dehalococcoides mccartyi]AOV99817.1 ribosomal large Subunit pseudouridine Synthase D [Dehalococcoides mccartyi]MBA2085598.1 Ribosomal large subunit pseudouridine synthase D [Dehalococcoides mccartyi]QBX64342.1 RluA family pseudouridine synthase [Dehalococcoides mccartyi]
MKTFKLVAETAGERLDKYITQKESGLSRSFIQELVSSGHILVNNQSAKPSLRLKTGDTITIEIPPETPSELKAEDIPLEIIFQDKDLLLINKPPGLTVHPAPGHPDHTLVNGVLALEPEMEDFDDPLRPGIVHRLDKDTSGLLLVAKNRQALANLSAQFKERTIRKYYLALVKGELRPAEGFIEAPLGRDPQNRQKIAVVSDGRHARTGYKVLRYIQGYSLLEVKLETGRTHQIRVHFAAIGHPVAGDAVYGQKESWVKRQFLHAHRLSFALPSNGQVVEFTSPLPPDLEEALKILETPS